MRDRNTFTKKDLYTVLLCAVFALANIAAIGSSGRRRAKEVVCSSHLKKWGHIWKHYVEEYERGGDKRRGYFAKRNAGNDWGMQYWWKEIWHGCFNDTGTFGQPGIVMPKTLAKMMLCPEAAKTGFIYMIPEGAENPYAAWDDIEEEFDCYCKSSYCINLWISNESGPQKGVTDGFWRSPYVQGAGNVPIFADGQWRDADPIATDDPPVHENDFWTPNVHEMRRFCVNRHNGGVNSLFMDLSVRKVGLKYLWVQKWHREWPEGTGHLPLWPPWMANFKDP